MAIKARFNGKCSICGLPTIAGMTIEKAPAGWAHETCAAGGEPPKAELMPIGEIRRWANFVYVVRGGKLAGHLRRNGEVQLLSRSEYQSGCQALEAARRLDPAAFERPTPPDQALTFGDAVFVVQE